MKNNYTETAQKVLRHLTLKSEGGNNHFSMEHWEWPQGVALYAMYKLWRKTGSGETLDYLKNWYADHMKKGLPPKNVNTMAPMLGLTCLYEQLGNPEWLPVIKEWAEWVLRDMTRTEQNGLQHITSGGENHQQLWDDTLYMTGMFLYMAGKVLKNREMKNLAGYQFLLHIRILQDEKSGLWYHGWTFEKKSHYGGIFWGRGNAWITACFPDFLEMLEETDAVYQTVLQSYRAQVSTLIKLQDEKTGLWRTVLDGGDKNGNYTETSASAGIAYGLLKGVRQGLLPKSDLKYAERALKGVLDEVDEQGLVQGTSFGTCVGDDAQYYLDIPVCPTAYGQGLTFLMLTEVME